MVDMILALVEQNCHSHFLNDNQLSSGFISTHAEAMRLLVSYGRVKLLHDSSYRDVTVEVL